MAEPKPLGSKGRVLFLRKYLEEHTDDDHYITTEELIKLYTENGYKANRQTVADDISVLVSSGFEIIVNQIPRNKTKTNAYHVGARLFELPELKMLVDAVSSSRFITTEKSELLIKKLSQLTNEENRQDLTARIFNDERLKTSNSNVFVNIDTIYNAIRDKKKIKFHYWDYAPDKKRVLKHDGEDYIASPYALIWNDDRYYMACHSEKHNKTVNYRIDRMCDVQVLYDDAYIDPEFNAAEYSRKVIKLYSDNLPERSVTLRCLNDHMRNVLDRFGEDTKTTIADENTFRAKVNVVPSSTFFGWVMQYKGGILIEKPATVKKSYEDMLVSILNKQAALQDGINGGASNG